MRRTVMIACAIVLAATVLAGCGQAQDAKQDQAENAASSTAIAAAATVGDTSAIEEGLADAAVSVPAEGADAEAPAAAEAPTSAEAPAAADDPSAAERFSIQVGGTTLPAVFADTDAARELAALLQNGPMTVELHSYGGFEKVGPLPGGLTAADEQITTEPGDIMLYAGDQITICYGSNTWEYTPLGKIEGATTESLQRAFGDGDIEVVLSL